MNSGKKVRNSSLAISAVVSALVQNLASIALKDLLGKLSINAAFLNAITSVLIYIITFLLSVVLLQNLAKIKWVRVHIFKEKIVEGKWFEVLYSDEQCTTPVGYGIVDTYFDASGEFVYEGIDYDMNTYKQTGSFTSTCSSLKYFLQGSQAALDYAYEYRNGSELQHGYGRIDFVVGKHGSNKHSGKFFNSDGNVTYFTAELITDKKVIDNLSATGETFYETFSKLVSDYFTPVNGQLDIITDIYFSNPRSFDTFCRYEDSKHNFQSFLNERFDFTGKVVIDMGCGTGRFSNMVVQDVGKLICTDNSTKMLQYCKNVLKPYSNKTEFHLCDHFALPLFVNEQADYIIAGYTFGAYFTNAILTDEKRQAFIEQLLDNCKKLLKSGGTLIIVETMGIDDKLLSFDKNLQLYFDYLDKLGFNKEVIDTSFVFDSKGDADSVIGNFWGKEVVSKIKKEGNQFILHEKSGIWWKKF